MFIHIFTFVLLSLGGNSVGLMAGIFFQDVKVASGVVPIAIMPFVLFSGFLKNRENLMSWISWIQYLSPMKYSFEAAMRNNFTGTDVDVLYYFI